MLPLAIVLEVFGARNVCAVAFALRMLLLYLLDNAGLGQVIPMMCDEAKVGAMLRRRLTGVHAMFA